MKIKVELLCHSVKLPVKVNIYDLRKHEVYILDYEWDPIRYRDVFNTFSDYEVDSILVDDLALMIEVK